LAPPDRFDRRVIEQRVSAQYCHLGDVPAAVDDRFEDHDALLTHGARHRGILRRHVDNLPGQLDARAQMRRCGRRLLRLRR
jgi:hypothetical protein